jgi:hypothetical protein
MRTSLRLAALVLLLVAACGGEEPRSAPHEPGSRLPRAPGSISAGCQNAAKASAFPVLCPATWPRHRGPGQPKLQFLQNTADAYLIDASNGFRRRGPHVFHVVLGGQRRPFRAVPTGIDPALRVTTRRVTIPMKGGGEFVQALPIRRVGTATVHDKRAALLRAPRYPQGGIHGGHVIILWNQDGHGYLVSAHGARMPQRDITNVALQVARSTHPQRMTSPGSSSMSASVPPSSPRSPRQDGTTMHSGTSSGSRDNGSAASSLLRGYAAAHRPTPRPGMTASGDAARAGRAEAGGAVLEHAFARAVQRGEPVAFGVRPALKGVALALRGRSRYVW